MVDATILGMLSLYPCSGYDMKIELEQGAAGMVSALTFGGMYPRLKQLEQAGLITTQQTLQTGRRRYVHELTSTGWHRLADSLTQPPAYPFPTRDELLLKLLFWGSAHMPNRAVLIEHLQLRREQSLDLLEQLRVWPKNGSSFVDEYGMLVLEYLRAHLQTELTWLDATMTQLENPAQPPVQDPRDLARQQRERWEAAFRQQPPASAADVEE